MKSVKIQFSEPELLKLLKEGNRSSLFQIYELYWDRLYHVAFNLLKNKEEAEECVQDVFISLWKRRLDIELTNSLKTYLTVAIKYQSINIIATKKRRNDLLKENRSLLDNPNTNSSPEEILISKELYNKLCISIDQLPPQCQLIYKLKEEGNTIKKISETLNLSSNTIKMHLKNANKKIRTRLTSSFNNLL